MSSELPATNHPPSIEDQERSGGDDQEHSDVVNSLLHPQALIIRQVLTRSGREELGLILIDDEENIAQALDARVAIDSLFYAGDKTISESLRQKLPPDVTIHEVAKRTCKKLFENEK